MTRTVVALAFLACVAPGTGSAETPGAGKAVTTPAPATALWGIAPNGGASPDAAALKTLRQAGVNALVVDVQRLGRSKTAVKRIDAMHTLADSLKMSLVLLVPKRGGPTTPALAHVLPLCSGTTIRCASLASSVSAAIKRAHVADRKRPLVAVYVSKPSMLAQVASLKSVRRRILVIAPLYTSFNSRLWGPVIASAASSPAADLAVAPVAQLGSPAVQRFGAALSSGGSTAGTGPDVTAPSAPSVSVVGVTASSASVWWLPSVDDVGVTAYRLYVGGTLFDGSGASPETIGNLQCGVPVTIGVDAVDAAGNASAQSTVTATPGPCGGAPPVLPPGDTTAPSTPTGLSVSAVGQTTVTLSWSASTDDVGVTGYRLFRNGSQVATSATTSYGYSSLTCGTTYTLGVAAVDAAGNVSGRATANVATAACPPPPPPDTTPPSTPTGLSTSAVSQTGAMLSWTASTDNVAVTGYRLFRDGSQVATSATTSYGYTGLTCGTTYTFGVAAVDGAGNVSGTATANVATSACPPPPPPDTTPPSTPTGLATSGVSQTAATLSWTASSDDVGVTGYRLFQGGNPVGTSTTTSYGYTGLTCATTYTLGVAAVDAAGNVSGTVTTTVTTDACPDTTPPSTPTGLATSGVSQTAASLSWTTSTDNVGVTGYRVFRNGTQVGTPATTNYDYTSLSCGTTYTLGVAAVDAAGNVSNTATKSVTTLACSDSTPPSTPTGLATSSIAQTSATLSWTASTDNVGVTGYRLFQGGTQVGTSATTSYNYTGLSCGTTYNYTGLTCETTYTLGVAAVDASGNVSGTATKSLTTAACPDTTPPSTPTGLSTSGLSQTGVTLSWTASSDNVGVTGYRLFQNGSQVGTSISPTFIFGGLTCATTYTLGVAAVDGAGNVSGTATVPVTTAACSGGGGGGSSPSVFVGQSTAGAADGSSCANARSAAYFNTASNWGAAKTFAPGVTVGLCGTISSTLTAQGSGTSGNPITLVFQSGAKLEQSVCDPCLNLDNRSFIVVDGNSTGQVDSSANGTSLANHARSTAITADPCTNCEIKNLIIGPVYRIAAGDSFICASGCAVDNAGVKCLRYSGANWKIDGNTMHDASWCLYEYGNGSEANTQIYGNNIYNIDHGWTITGGGPYGHLYFHNNHMHDMGAWDACDSGSNCHHDGVHCFFGPGSAASFAGSYIYDNTFDGTLGSSATAWIYLESNPGSPCATPSSKWYIFNNVFSSSDQVSTNPYVTVATGTAPNTVYLYNNTFSGPGGGHFGPNGAACSDTSVDFENNAVGGCSQFNGAGSGLTDYNAYAFQSTATNCWPVSGGTCTFSSWQATGHDTHGAFSKLGAVGSNAAGVGANLTSLCTGDLTPLCSDINGVPRPTTGPWTAGALG